MDDSLNIFVFKDNWLVFKQKPYRCALGKSGINPVKVEGDGVTPTGSFPMRYGLYRPDRGPSPETVLSFKPISPKDGWCDDPTHADYNRPVSLPFPASHEELWRSDEIYDLIVVLGHNDSPPIAGLGSAIFFHIARPDYSPTQGCVAVSKVDMLEILKNLSHETHMVICDQDYQP